MKRNCRIRRIGCRLRITAWAAGAAFVFSSAILPRPASANPELDHQFALETIGFLKSWDNVDGLFADYVADAYKDFFSRQSRFVLQDLSKADTILSSSKIPYGKLIDDPAILGQIARSTKSQSILRTKIEKEGHQYLFTIDWLHAPDMEQIASEGFTLQETHDNEPFGLGDVKGALQDALGRLIAKLPFQATITGRDNNSVTIDIGKNANLQAGDTLVVATLDEVKKHPLLHQIVDWRFTRTGKVEVTSVDEGLSFGKVVQEEPGHQIQRYQKVIQIIPRANPPQPTVINEKDEAKQAAQELPRLGYVAGDLGLGGFGRDYSNPKNAAASSNNSGFYLGGAAEAELWLTKEFFGDLAVGYGFWNDTITDTSAGSPNGSQGAGSGSVVDFLIDAGYTYLVTGDFFGPKGWIKIGYHSASYTLPLQTQAGDTVSAPISFNSLFLGIGGDLPIRGPWGAMLNFNFGVLPGANESSNINGTVNSATDITFYAGGYYRLTNRITLRAGIDIEANSVDFSSGATAAQRTVNFIPSIMYYF